MCDCRLPEGRTPKIPTWTKRQQVDAQNNTRGWFHVCTFQSQQPILIRAGCLHGKNATSPDDLPLPPTRPNPSPAQPVMNPWHACRGASLRHGVSAALQQHHQEEHVVVISQVQPARYYPLRQLPTLRIFAAQRAFMFTSVAHNLSLWVGVAVSYSYQARTFPAGFGIAGLPRVEFVVVVVFRNCGGAWNSELISLVRSRSFGCG